MFNPLILLYSLLLLPSSSSALYLNTNSSYSIKSAAKGLASSLQPYITNTSSQPLVQPWLWWQAGALWAAYIDYWHYTGDSTYVVQTQQGLAQQLSNSSDFMAPSQMGVEGNDDQAWYCFAALSALEYGFPELSTGPGWLQIAKNVYDEMVGRWDTSVCGGGIRWQISPSNPGYTYKNAIANGAFFQIAARLARYTGDAQYADMASTIWDWASGIGIISPDYDVYDGVHVDDCGSLTKDQWSYNVAVWLHGTAALYNMTSSASWQTRTSGLLASAQRTFASPYANATSILYEQNCEMTEAGCDTDQRSFKAYMGRWLGKSSVLAPFIAGGARELLQSSAEGAAQNACQGQTCGLRWWAKDWDGSTGFGEQLAVLETVMGLLASQAGGPRTA